MPPSGHGVGRTDCYASADMLPLTHKADLLLEPNGEPRPVPDHLAGDGTVRHAETAGGPARAVWLAAFGLTIRAGETHNGRYMP
ncbi:hypothetical protein GCM10010415_66490 [Streptomyces atrovirens]